ncbi:MAG: Crp/Fnr family transcriptional regulator [Lachnospiraceae bacterium]|nr:Crp/Fnr family transcriptional regulator [Lachnospiraceae bacterium]
MLNEKDYASLRERLPFWEYISEDLTERLRTHSYVREFIAGEKITDAGNSNVGLVVVMTGRIRVSLVSSNAREVTISVARRDEIIYIGGNPTPNVLNNYELEAEVDSRGIVVQMVDFEQLLHSDLHIENTVLRSVLGQFNRILFDMQNFLFQDLDSRLAAQLLFESHQQGGSTIITTHQRIANSIASSREVVSRTLKLWERRGLLTLSRGRISLHKLDELSLMAGE